MNAEQLRNWLEEQFKVHPHKKKAALAQALGLEAPAISKILNGARQIKATEHEIMKEFFGVHDNPTEQSPFMSMPPATAHMQDSADNTGEQWAIPKGILQENTDSNLQDVQNFRVNDNMMAPEFNRGEYVTVDTSKTHPETPGTFILSDGIYQMLRNCELVIGSTSEEVKITALKKGFQPQKLKLDEIHIIGKVIAKLQWI